jgi:hypothetical protein
MPGIALVKSRFNRPQKRCRHFQGFFIQCSGGLDGLVFRGIRRVETKVNEAGPGSSIFYYIRIHPVFIGVSREVPSRKRPTIAGAGRERKVLKAGACLGYRKHYRGPYNHEDCAAPLPTWKGLSERETKNSDQARDCVSAAETQSHALWDSFASFFSLSRISLI